MTTNELRKRIDGKTLSYAGDTWTIVGVGTVTDDAAYLNLNSQTRGRQQRNGWMPVGIVDWIKLETIFAGLEA